MARFAEVILPLPIPMVFTYAVPKDLEEAVKPLHRVLVPLGSRKFYTGIVVEITEHKKVDYDLKEILQVSDNHPILKRSQLQLWQWMADYYMCAIGDVMKAALPSGLKPESETIIEVNSDFDDENPDFTPSMVAVWEVLKKKDSISFKELRREGIPGIDKAVYTLLNRGAITVREQVAERFRPKIEEFYVITIERDAPESLNEAFKRIRSPRHQSLFMHLLERSDFMKHNLPIKEVSRSSLAEVDCFDRAIIASFAKKGFIRIERRETSRFRWDGTPPGPLPLLSEAQNQALKQIHQAFSEFPTVLFHGVTSSGKTEVYFHLIDFVLKQNKQVLYLVPEIALTTQLTRRLQKVFGSKVVIYHSKFSDAERVEIWQKLIATDEPMVIIGARSSVFLPFTRLGLVIVDEEHEQSYKQFDPAPRYNARDVAIVLSRLFGARTLLGSASPSVETYYKATSGQFGLVSLKERYGGASLAEIEIVDLVKARNKKDLAEALAGVTVRKINDALNNDEQAIVFHNRRGYSPMARCRSCEYIPKCDDCDVSLSYHKRINRMVCHYCGREYPLPELCPVCKQPTVQIEGFGTERVEDVIDAQFPKAKVLRMDLDSTRNKSNYSAIIDTFSEHKADILVGTQMVTKGLDFDGVSTVAVLNADNLIYYPDFRASERAFNMLLQVAGRAGRRREKKGSVIIQTRQPQHPVLNYVVNHDYEGFYEYELAERQNYAYPPFTRLVYIFVRHREANICSSASEKLANVLKSQLGSRVLGPHEPAVNRIKTYYFRRIMIKVETAVSIKQVKDILRQAVTAVKTEAAFRNVDIYFDVDPM